MEERNEPEQDLIDICTANELIMENTLFQHHQLTHVYTHTWAYDLKPIWGGTKFLPEKFVTVIVSQKKKKKNKKGHCPFRCTLSITFRLNMPSNVGPKWY